MSGVSTAGPGADGGVYDVVGDRVLGLAVETPLPWVRVLVISGELDQQTAPRLVACVDAQLDAGAEHVVLDLSRLNLLSPVGLATLAEVQTMVSAVGATLHLAGICRPAVIGPVQDHWQPEVFAIHRTTIEALAAISG
ncbi:MAG: STAS domain-containing protein [Pseudonocardiaceae bacterium]